MQHKETNLARLSAAELDAHVKQLRATYVSIDSDNRAREQRLEKETAKLERGRRAHRETGRLITVAQSAIDRRGQGAKT